MSGVGENIKKNPNNIAYKKLRLFFSFMEQEKLKLDHEWLYICARKSGDKIKSIWINGQENLDEPVSQLFGSTLAEATSFEVELLYKPQQSHLDLNQKNQWNSFRGKKAMVICYAGHTTKWSGLEMISRNLSFNRVAYHHLAQSNNKFSSNQLIPVTTYNTKQYFCDNSLDKNGVIQPKQLFRGNLVVAIDEVNKDSLLTSVKGMTHWLATQVSEGGQAHYKYWPSRGEYATSNNAIRQWMATVCLNRAANAFKNEGLNEVAEENLAYNLRTMLKLKGDYGYIWMNGSAKLGAAALAGLAIFESPHRKKYLREEYALRKLISVLSNEDGSFDTFYIPRNRKDNQNFYSGEALLFLASQYTASRNPNDLDRFMSAFDYYREWHLQHRNPAFVPWHTQAYFLVWGITKDESLKDFIFEMNDWLLSMQQWGSASFADMQGRFYDPQRPYYGPPHASSTGVYLEGLIDAFQLAKYCNDACRTENYRIAIVRGIRSIMQLQYKNETDCFYVKNTAQVLGGVRTTVYDNAIRIDNVQHALMAFFKISARFDIDDYRLPIRRIENVRHDSFENNEYNPENDEFNQEDFLGHLWTHKDINGCLNVGQTINLVNWKARSVIVRSEKLDPYSLYFARHGVGEAIRTCTSQPNNCIAVIAEEDGQAISEKTGLPVYEVDSLLDSARALADKARERTVAKVIGITGSVGKTSIKDVLSQVLAEQGSVHSTSRNANDGWGVLETLMNMPSDIDFSVMEMGMLGKDSIQIKSNRIRPHIGIITNIYDAHMAYHNSRDSIAHTKSGIFSGMENNGIAILPADSDYFDYLKGRASKAGIDTVITFGKHENADFKLVRVEPMIDESVVYASILGESVAFEIGIFGEHWGVNTMAILAGVHSVGGDLKIAINALSKIKPSFRRGEVHHIDRQFKKYTVIDDTWNASPVSVIAALKNLSLHTPMNNGRRVVFLGDMLQLGKNEVDKHIELVEAVVENSVGKVYTVGDVSSRLLESLPSSIKGDHFKNAVDAAAIVFDCVNQGDVILVKGSNAMEMWRVVTALCAKNN